MTTSLGRVAVPATSKQLVAGLSAEIDTIADLLVARILAADRSYVESPLLTPEQLRGACVDNLSAMVRLLAGLDDELGLDSARATGRLKAEQGVPIAALLHAYRLGGRLIWEELLARAAGVAERELLALPAQLWAIVDVYSDAAAEAYRETEQLLAHADAESRARLIRALFDDHGGNPARTLDAWRALGLPEHASFAVVSAEIDDARPTVSVEAEARLGGRGLVSIWDTQADAHVGLVCASAAAALDSAFDDVGAVFGGNVGVSRIFARPDGIAAALGEARLARRCVPGGRSPVVRYESVPLDVLLVRLPDAARGAAEQILGPLARLPEPERADLLSTLDAWFQGGGSNAAAARHLHVHRNTMLYRLRKIRDLTGRDVNDPAQAAELYIALRATHLAPGLQGT